MSTIFLVVLFGIKVILVLKFNSTVLLIRMVLKGKGSIYQHVKGKMYVYIPASVRDDSQFPFKPGEKVLVSINNNKLIIEKDERTP